MERLNSGIADFINQAPVGIGGGYKVDFDTRIVVRPDGSQVRLSKGETYVLGALNDGWKTTVELDELISTLRGDDRIFPHSGSYIKDLVHRLRQKIEPDPKNPTHIESKHSWGYRLAKDKK